jgi:hypothetical protein
MQGCKTPQGYILLQQVCWQARQRGSIRTLAALHRSAHFSVYSIFPAVPSSLAEKLIFGCVGSCWKMPTLKPMAHETGRGAVEPRSGVDQSLMVSDNARCHDNVFRDNARGYLNNISITIRHGATPVNQNHHNAPFFWLSIHT